MAVLFRALIMLVFLGTAAATWFSIGPLPDKAQSMVNRLFCSANQLLGWERETGYPWVKSAPRFEPPYETLECRDAIGQQAGGPFVDQRLRHMLTQLRRIGAVDYRLEHWGSGGLFRFCCTMPLVGHQNQSRQFEAIDDDITCAVDTVLGDVANWRK